MDCFIMLSLKKVTQDNWRAVANLSVKHQQHSFIEANSISLLESAFDLSFSWVPLALYDKDTLIGFAMVGAFDKQENSIWLDRFMIDQNFQGKGYGKKALPLIIDFIKHNWEVNQIILSAHEENQEIFSFYEAFGFKNTHQLDKQFHEIIMTLTW